jgi:hypothetical protein
MYTWLRNLAAREQDCTIEDRGAKGSGKSNGMFWTILQVLGPRVPDGVAVQTALDALCYNRPQYAAIFRRIRAARDAGDWDSPMFIWGDDADQLFDRRAHATGGNRAMLGLYRKSRDQLRSIQLLGTQDDFLEGPILEGGNYVKRIYTSQGVADVYWPVWNKRREGDPKWEYLFTQEFPDPHVTYPVTWRTKYQPARRRLTTDTMDDLLEIIDPQKPQQGEAPTVKQAIIREHEADPGASSAEVTRRLLGKGVSVTYNYVNLIIRQHDSLRSSNSRGSKTVARPAATGAAPSVGVQG